MTAATRKAKTVQTKPLLQKGDRITGNTSKGTPYTGTFEGHNSKDLVLCNTGEKVIALDPATVARLAGHGHDPTRVRPTLLDVPTSAANWQPQYGDRVRGENLDGKSDQGIITQLGQKYAILDNQQRRNVKVDSLELLQAQAVPDDLLHLVGLSWLEQVDQVFQEFGISNLGNFIGEEPDLQLFERWREWEISFHKSKEVHLSNVDRKEHAWFISLGKAMSLKSNGDISKFCRQAIDRVEDAIALIEVGINGQEPNWQVGDRCYYVTETNTAQILELKGTEAQLKLDLPSAPVWLSLKSCHPLTAAHVRDVQSLEPGSFIKGESIGGKPYEGKFKNLTAGGMAMIEQADGKSMLLVTCTLVLLEGKSSVEFPNAVETAAFDNQSGAFAPDQRIRVIHSDTPTDIGRPGTVQPPWDSQQQAAAYLKVLLDGDEVCRAFRPEAVEVLTVCENVAAPMQSLAAMLPAVAASIVTSAQTEAAIAATRLETLAAEVEAIYAEAEEAEATMLNAGRAAFTRSLALGEKLLTAKAEPSIGGYGKWLPWLEARGIPERKAQRAIRLYSHRQLLEQSDAVTELTLTEALDLVSKKSLKPAVTTPITAQTPDTIEQQYSLTGDHATPTLEELMLLYTQLGAVKLWRKGFAVEREAMGAPFPLAFQNRASAWKRWQEEWRSFAVEHPLSATERPSNGVSIVPENIDALVGKNQASSTFEYEPIDSIPVWFDPGGGVVEGQAIATNGKGMMRITWGEDRESDVPRDRVRLSNPSTTAVTAEIEAGLAAIGLEVCQPSIPPEEFNREMWGQPLPTVQANGLAEERPACSRWLPQEVDNVARIALQGLLKHLSPSELVKAAIVHAGVSLPDTVRVVLEMANKDDFEQILEVLDGGLKA